MSKQNNCANPDVVVNLRSRIAGSGLKKKFIAKSIGITDVYLSMLLSGTRTVPEHIIAKIFTFLEKFNKLV